jgi:hypothetical protein
MSYQEHGIERGESQTIDFRNFLGYILIGCGVAIAFWVVINVYEVFTQPAKLMPFQKLVASNLETTVSQANKEAFKLVIPAEVLSYFIPLVLLIIAVSIASMLFTGGIRILCGIHEKHPAEKTR